MTKKKVILLGKLPPPYMGPAIATKILLNSDLKNKYELFFLNTKANDSIHTLGKWSVRKIFKNISLYSRLTKLIRKNRPDIVLIPISQASSGFIKDSFYILVARMFRVKVLLQLRGSDFKNWLENSSGILRWYVRFILRRSEGVIVLGNKLRYLFANHFPPEKIFVVPNGSDYIIPQKSNSSDEIKILYLSNLLASKGIEDVFLAIEILYRSHKNISVDLIGEWLHPEIKKVCLAIRERSGLPIRIHTSEESKDKFSYLANADIFLFPPREPEGHPWSVVEAMAAGLPVISTDKGAITESVIDNANGFIVEPGNPGMIAEKLTLLIVDKSLREQMGKESRNLYLKNFTEEKMIEKLSSAINCIIENK